MSQIITKQLTQGTQISWKPLQGGKGGRFRAVFRSLQVKYTTLWRSVQKQIKREVSGLHTCHHYSSKNIKVPQS